MLEKRRIGAAKHLRLSVIILAHNNLSDTIECFESVRATLPVKEVDRCEILILSNGSTDGTDRWIEYQEEMSEGKDLRVRGIYSVDNLGFGAGNNEALKYAIGDIVVFLNNDTIVTPGWIEELCFPLMCLPDVAFTVPVSNSVGGLQQIETRYGNTEEMLAFAGENLRKNHLKTEVAGVVTGLCLATRWEVVERLKGFYAPAHQFFDERFWPGMFEDNDLCLRASLAGLKSLICYGAFVHHKGSKTFKSIGSPRHYFDSNRERFQSKWREIWSARPQRIAAMLRVKDGIRHIDRFLSEALRWCDKVVILDTGSTDGTIEVIERYRAAIPDPTTIILDKTTFRDTPLQEYDERQFLLEMAQETGVEWLLRLDVDEAFEDRIGEILHLLTNPYNPEILCWQFPLYTFWRGETKYRVDSHWRQMAPYALFRNIPGRTLTPNDHPQGFHCPSIPIFPAQNIGFCSVPILHYGYSDWSEVERKFRWYQEADQDKRAADIGGAGDYSHLVDEGTLQLARYSPRKYFSVNMISRVRELPMAARLIETIRPIVGQVVIVVTDGEPIPARTKRWLKDLRVVVVEGYLWQDNFAEARNLGLDICTGEWILHLDPDEKLSRGSAERLLSLMEDETALAWTVGIINFFEDPGSKGSPDAHYQRSKRIFRNRKEIRYSNPVHETIDDAMKRIPGGEQRIRESRINIEHYGFLLPPDEFAQKMEYYARLNEKWMEEDPGDPRPFYNLGIHYLDRGNTDRALFLLGEARAKNEEKGLGLWQASMALSGIYLRAGLEHTIDTIRQMPDNHSNRRRLVQLVNYLETRVGKVRQYLKSYYEERDGASPADNEARASDEHATPDGTDGGRKGD